MRVQPREYESKCLHMSASQCAFGSQAEITGQKHQSPDLGQGSLVAAFCQKNWMQTKKGQKKADKNDLPHALCLSYSVYVVHVHAEAGAEH